MGEFHLYKLNNQDSDLEIVYAFNKKKKSLIYGVSSYSLL